MHYYAGLLVYATRIVKDREAASDILQDLFVTLWERRAKLSRSTLKPYMFNSVHNQCMDHLRRLKIRTEYQERILAGKEPIGPDTWDFFVESELRSIIGEAIAKLPPQRQAVVRLNRIENKSADEIAQELNIAKRTVDKHLQLGIQELRRELAEYLPLLLIMFGRWY